MLPRDSSASRPSAPQSRWSCCQIIEIGAYTSPMTNSQPCPCSVRLRRMLTAQHCRFVAGARVHSVCQPIIVAGFGFCVLYPEMFLRRCGLWPLIILSSNCPTGPRVYPIVVLPGGKRLSSSLRRSTYQARSSGRTARSSPSGANRLRPYGLVASCRKLLPEPCKRGAPASCAQKRPDARFDLALLFKPKPSVSTGEPYYVGTNDPHVR